MKFCKIVLIVFLVIKSVRQAILTLSKDDVTLGDVFTDAIAIACLWLLYWGAGVLDV